MPIPRKKRAPKRCGHESTQPDLVGTQVRPELDWFRNHGRAHQMQPRNEIRDEANMA